MGRTAKNTLSWLRAIGYMRVSTEQQEQSGLGLEAQEREIRELAERLGVELVGWRQECRSGGASLEERTELMAVPDDMQELDAGLLLIQARDRLARDVLTAEVMERWVDRIGGTIVAPGHIGDGSPEDKVTAQVLDIVGQYERALIGSRIRRALASRRAQGLQPSGTAPYGYTWSSGRLVAAPTEQAVLRKIGRLRDAGYSIREIAHELDAVGCRTRAGTAWSRNQVHRVLQRAA